MKGSVVLDAATPMAHSRIKGPLLYAVAGLIGGLVLGIGIIVIMALVSDKLRRRDEVAYALGAPVKFSVGAVGRNRWLSRHDDRPIERVAAYLGGIVSLTNSPDTPALAVVAVDDPKAAALAVVSLAVSFAKEGMQVVLADLARDAPAARLLGAGAPGVGEVAAGGAHLVLAVPERDDLAPAGPFGRAPAQGQHSPLTKAVATACSQADVLLTLITLDSSVGGDHLRTWTADAVAIITAGRSSWTRVSAVGEMIRLSGTRLVSAVLIGADKSDESLGAVETPHSGSDADGPEHGARSGANRFTVAIGENHGRQYPVASDHPR